MDSANSNLYPTNNDSPAREKLLTLRLALLASQDSHQHERREYDASTATSTPASSSTGYRPRAIRLAAQHSEFVVRIDETLDGQGTCHTGYTAAPSLSPGKCLFPRNLRRLPEKYFDAIQRDRRWLSTTPSSHAFQQRASDSPSPSFPDSLINFPSAGDPHERIRKDLHEGEITANPAGPQGDPWPGISIT